MGYDIYNNLIYQDAFYINNKNDLEINIEKIFKDNDKIALFKLMKEKIIIRYNKLKKHLIIKNKNININDDNILNNYKNFIYNFSELKELTIDGFTCSLNQIKNNNIISLNLRHPSYFKNKFLDISIFNNLEYFSIGDYTLKNRQNLFKYIKYSSKLKKMVIYSKNIKNEKNTKFKGLEIIEKILI